MIKKEQLDSEKKELNLEVESLPEIEKESKAKKQLLVYQEKLQKLKKESQRLKRIFGEKVNLGEAEKEIEIFRQLLDKKGKKINKNNSSLEIGEEKIKNASDSNKVESKEKIIQVDLAKKTLALIRKKISGYNIKAWNEIKDKPIKESSLENDLSFKILTDIIKDVLGKDLELSEKNETWEQWTLEIIKLALSLKKLSELENELKRV